MSSLSVLSAKTWQMLFSEEKYNQAVASKKPVVEFLVALGRPDSEVMQHANEKPLNPFKLSVLDLAIMKGRESLVAKLLAAGAKVDEPDLFGWLPIHHACLAGDAIFQRVVKGGAKPDAQTAAGASCEDIRRYAGIDELATSLTKLSIEDEAENPVRTLQKYTDYPYYEGDGLQKLWQTKPSDLKPAVRKLVDSSLSEGTKTSIRKTQAGWGLFAEESIPFEKIIIPYSGTYGSWEEKLDLTTGLTAKATWQRYQLGRVNAETVGNVARFANEGFPNSMIMELPLYRGSLDWYTLVACDKEGIAAGDEILWDYGMGECLLKWNSLYTIPNKEAMRSFIKMHPFHEIDRFIMEHSLRFNPQMPFTKENHSLHQQAEGYLSKLYYCFHTPAAVVDLWCESLITARSWSETMRSVEKKQQRLTHPTHRKVLFLVYLFMEMLVKLEGALIEHAPKRIKPIKAWLATLATRLTMLEFSEVCVEITQWLKEPIRDSWDDFSEKLVKKHTHQPERDIRTLTLMKTYAKALSTAK